MEFSVLHLIIFGHFNAFFWPLTHISVSDALFNCLCSFRRHSLSCFDFHLQYSMVWGHSLLRQSQCPWSSLWNPYHSICDTEGRWWGGTVRGTFCQHVMFVTQNQEISKQLVSDQCYLKPQEKPEKTCANWGNARFRSYYKSRMRTTATSKGMENDGALLFHYHSRKVPLN